MCEGDEKGMAGTGIAVDVEAVTFLILQVREPQSILTPSMGTFDISWHSLYLNRARAEVYRRGTKKFHRYLV
jgi:hypothetical protein